MDFHVKVEQFIDNYNLNNDVNIRILDLISEVGELSKEFLKNTEYGLVNFRINEN